MQLKEYSKLKNKINKTNWVFAVLLLSFFILSIFYVNNAKTKTVESMRRQAVLVADLASSGINGEMIKTLQAVPEDEQTVAFHSIKKRLADYLKADKDLRFVYLYTIKSDKVYFMVDAEPMNSEDYSPPGQEYVEADEEEKRPFLDGQSLVVGPTADRWGVWMSILSPLKDENSGKVFAVLGMDYPAEVWNVRVDDAVKKSLFEVAVVLFLIVFIYIIFIRNIKSEEKFRSLIKNIPSVVFRCKIDKDLTMIFINNQIEELSGFPPTDFINNSKRSFASIIYHEDAIVIADDIQRAIDNKQKYNVEYRIKTSNDEIVWVKERGEAIYNFEGKPEYLDGFILDITKDKEILSEIKNKQEELSKINKFMVGRELKMLELKKKIKELEEKINKN